jgi:zinc protease
MIRSHIRPFILVFAILIFNASLVHAQTGKPDATKTPSAETKAPAKAPSAQSGQDIAATDLKAIKKPPLPAFHPQQPTRFQLDNGMVIFLQEDHELPLINGIAYIRGGSKEEPADKVGMVSIYGSAWRTGGTKTKTGDQLDDMLEARAARVETSGGNVSTTLRLSCLKGDFDTVLDVFNDVLRNPEFRQEKIDLAKDGIRAGIARRNDNLGQIAGREANKLGYGPNSPYARVAEYATVNAVTRQDLLDWHAKHVYPNNIILGITGDFDSKDMEARLRKMFDGWAKGPADAPPQVAVSAPNPGMYFVEKEDVNQSEIRMVAPGLRRDDPDFYAAEVMNQIFGGSFASRLFSNLRTKAGLAYSVSGAIEAPFDHPGLTRVSIGTKSGTTAQAVEGLYKEIDDMRNNPVTAVELQRGKDAILNSFVFEFDSKEKVMNERMIYELYGYPADFLERYQKGVEGVTAADVDRVAKKYLIKDKFAVLVVGKSADFDKQLDTFGKVTKIDITIPQPGSKSGAEASAAAPANSNPEGKALVAKVMEAAGGADKLGGVKAVRVKSTLLLKAQGMSLETEATEVPPDKMHMKMNTPGGELTMVYSPQESFMAMGPMGVRPMPSSQRENSADQLRSETWTVAKHLNDPQYIFSAQGTEKIGDVQAAVLDIYFGGRQLVRWYVDPASGRVVREQSQVTGQTGPETRVVDHSEWKTVDGITVPFHEELSVNGKPQATITISSYEFNPTVDPKIFEKPATGGGDQK